MRLKRFVVFLAVASLMMLTLGACGTSNTDDGTKKSEFDMVEEVRNHDLGTYVSDRYDTMYMLGIEGELVILKMPGVNQYILADNPDRGNHFYEEVIIEKDLKPVGASEKYIFFEDVSGQKFAVMRVNDVKDVRVGEGILMGNDVSTPFSELSEEEKEFIPISYETDVIPEAVTTD